MGPRDHAGSCNSLSLISELSRHLATMANMTFEDVDVEAVAELSAEEVEQMILGVYLIPCSGGGEGGV